MVVTSLFFSYLPFGALTYTAEQEQRYTYRVLQTIQMKLIEPAILGSAKTALKFKYEIEIG